MRCEGQALEALGSVGRRSGCEGLVGGHRIDDERPRSAGVAIYRIARTSSGLALIHSGIGARQEPVAIEVALGRNGNTNTCSDIDAVTVYLEG